MLTSMKFIKTLFLCLLLAPSLAQAQIITTVAGNGTAGYSGDGGQATAAELFEPYFIAIDKSDNIYISDNVNSCIRRVSRAGFITTIAGVKALGGGYSGDGGLATAAAFSNVEAMALDGIGNLYVVDRGNNCIRKISTAGIITTVAGTGTGGISGDGGQATASALFDPTGIFVDKAGNLFIGETFKLRKVNTTGIISTIAGDGTSGYGGDGGPATAAQINRAEGNFIDSFGNIYFSDANKVRMINTTGIISTVMGTGFASFGGDGGPATDAAVDNPNGITADKYGNIYISDAFNQRIRKINKLGIVNTVAGTGAYGYNGDGINALAAQLCTPLAGAFDSYGIFYIADACNNRIRKIQFNLPVNAIQQGNTSISIEPNPANNRTRLLLTLNYSGEVNIQVLDLLGRTVDKFEASANKPIDRDFDLPDGVYFVVANVTGQQFFEKMIIQRR